MIIDLNTIIVQLNMGAYKILPSSSQIMCPLQFSHIKFYVY